MIGLASAFLFVGYTLVYAAVANGGKFANQPWESLRRDAYDTGGGQVSASAASGRVAHRSTFDRIASAAGWVTAHVPIGMP